MKRTIFFSLLLIITTSALMSQSDLDYYHTIPESPDSITGATVLSRSIDGLGFRYYHATEDLTVTDLEYSAGNGSRMVIDLLQHIYTLSEMVVNAVHIEPNQRPTTGVDTLTYSQLRIGTLANIKLARERTSILSDQELAECSVKFERNGDISEYPIWNLINGPLADAMWHTGQIVSHRRAAGNPINPKISVFSGTVRD